ncbi:uncharacterized protein C8Q71DRAFT_675425, partial [Rhodofomes roseus]
SMRKATRATQKVPANANDLLRAMHARITFAFRTENIKPEVAVNADQAGVMLFPTGKYTYEKRGSKDVSVAGHEERRQFTIVTASSMAGQIIPFQSVWGGTTDQSLPSRSDPNWPTANLLGFRYAHGDTRHWSSRETTKQWVEEVLDPFFAGEKKRLGLAPESKSLLLIDVWPVHIAKSSPDDFLPWMVKTHSNIVIIFVPGGC